MEKYKEELKRRLKFYSIIFTICIAITLLCNLNVIEIKSDDVELADFLNGMLTGVMVGFELLIAAYVAKTRKALVDDEVLEKLYIEENDERNKYILAKIGGHFFTYVMVGQLVMMFLLAFVDVELTKGVLIIIVIEGLARLIMKMYYSKTI